MRLSPLIFLTLWICGCATNPPASSQSKLALINAIPKMRHEALLLCAEGPSGDTTPERFEKQRQYIEALRDILKKLNATYYPDDEPIKGLDDAIELHAIELARLDAPNMWSRHGSGYEASIISHTIELYENLITNASGGICFQLGKEGISISYDKWLSNWKKAASPAKPHNKT